MRNRRNILMICPWLNHQSPAKGMVFREQTAVVSDVFGVTFITFQKWGIKELFKYRKLSSIHHHLDSSTGQQYWYCHYFNSTYVWEWVNRWMEKYISGIAFRRLKQSRITFDLIHAQSLLETGIFAHDFSARSGIPYIITEHAQICLMGVTVRRQKKLQSILRGAQKRLVVSRHKIAQYASNRLYGEFEVIGNMVDGRIFQYQPKTGSKDFFKIVTVGAYTPIKDHYTILKALKRLDAIQLPRKVEFHWVGFDAWLPGKTQEVSQIIERMEFKQVKIKLNGLLSRKEMAALYAEGDLFTFSSLAEGMPLAILEALTCGLPVVTTHWGGAEEIIDDHNGCIVPLRDDQNMALEILAIIHENKSFDRAEIAERSRRLFGHQVFSERIKSIYDTVLHEYQ